MRHSVGAIATACLSVAALAAAALLFSAASSDTALAYSGAQAEAQSDPYAFPNIELCCKPKPQRRPKPHHGGGHGNHPYPYPYPEPGYPNYPHGYVRVSCGEPRPYSYSSVREALDHVRQGGRILINPNSACDISGLTIDESVLIQTDDEAGGGRAELVGRECASIAPGYGSSTVTFRDVDIDGCLIVNHGRLAFHQVNLASRGSGDAVRLNGGSFTSTDSTIRARGTAVNAVRGGVVSLAGGGFASGPRAESTIVLNVDGATITNSLIKGGLVGVRVGMTGRSPVTFTDVQVLRGEANEIYQIGPGQAGILVGGPGPGDDLPSLPSLPGTRFTMDRGVIAGYGDALVFGPGTRGAAKGVNIAYPGRGIVVAAGADVYLQENRISHAKRTGIDLESGVSGKALLNTIQCDHGSCVCYGGDCTSRADRDFGHGAFEMRGTRCDD